MSRLCSGVTALTLFDLVIRSMRKNIKHYYLYFFALILSVVLYFVFATLQYDSAILELSGTNMGTAFQAAGILLLFIAGIFVVYANSIFLKRRSREIGLYQLIGLTKRVVARLLIVENILLGIGALIIGIAVGLLVSRVFLLLLMKLIGYESFIEVSFSVAAVVQTIVVFIGIFALTTVQMIVMVFRNTLLSLFNSDKAGEHPKKPKTGVSAAFGVLGLLLIGFGYWFSGRMLNELFFFNILIVLATVIAGTYLLFRVTISWLLFKVRSRKEGHLGLLNSLSLAPLMHRLKGNANSLTVITILSAMTLTMVAFSYAMYYETERETDIRMPFDFMFENDEAQANEIMGEMDQKGIGYQHGKVEMLVVPTMFEQGVFPGGRYERPTAIISDEQLQAAGIEITAPKGGSASYHDASSISLFADSVELPIQIEIQDENLTTVEITKMGERNVLNWSIFYGQLVVNEESYQSMKNKFSGMEGAKVEFIDGFHILNEKDQETASALFQQPKYTSSGPHVDYYSSYKEAVQDNGLIIFIAGFLGLVFLISTGSILYFKQMTEAEQEKKSYATLRQLGFTGKEIMKGIIRKQVFVFGLPLAIGLLHSIFAMKAASFFFQSDILMPATLAMGVYTLIYTAFAFLTIGYYRKTVNAAL